MVEQEPNEQRTNYYEDPALIEAAGGDRLLLDRLVAQRIAEDIHAQDPDNPIHVIVLQALRMAVEEYRQQHKGGQ